MSVKNVVLAQRNGNGVDVVLPRTSADLTGYENADAPGVDNVAGALDELYARNPGDTSSLTGRVEALETGQAEQDEDIAALESGVADWTASKPGIVQRVEAIVQRVEALEAEPDPTPESIGAAKAKHAAQHATGGGDAVTPDSIGAAQKIHTHTFADISGTLSPSQGGTGNTTGQVAFATLANVANFATCFPGVFAGISRKISGRSYVTLPAGGTWRWMYPSGHPTGTGLADHGDSAGGTNIYVIEGTLVIAMRIQ